MQQAEPLQQLEVRASSEKDDTQKFFILQAIGNIYSKAGNDSKALIYYEQASGAARRANSKKQECDALINIGSALFNLKRFDEGIRNYNKALTLAKEMEDYKAQSIILGKLADAYLSLGENNQAIEYFNLGTKELRKEKPFSEEKIQELLFYEHQAKSLSKRARRILPPFLTSVLFLLATILAGFGINLITVTPPSVIACVAFALSAITVIVSSAITVFLIRERDR